MECRIPAVVDANVDASGMAVQRINAIQDRARPVLPQSKWRASVARSHICTSGALNCLKKRAAVYPAGMYAEKVWRVATTHVLSRAMPVHVHRARRSWWMYHAFADAMRAPLHAVSVRPRRLASVHAGHAKSRVAHP